MTSYPGVPFLYLTKKPIIKPHLIGGGLMATCNMSCSVTQLFLCGFVCGNSSYVKHFCIFFKCFKAQLLEKKNLLIIYPYLFAQQNKSFIHYDDANIHSR